MHIVRLACTVCLLCVVSSTATSKELHDNPGQEERPNIVVIFTDDMGYADLGVQDQVADIRTPNLDQMAREGVRFTDGYITAPQCVPSRAGILSGQYQQRFGLDANGLGPLPQQVITIADRLRDAGYTTGMVGKWHLDPNPTDQEWLQKTLPAEAGKKSPRVPGALRMKFLPFSRGFEDVFDGPMNNVMNNFDLTGKSLPLAQRRYKGFRLDIQTDAGLSFIDRHRDEPFFLYLAYFAPHVPLAATEKYLSRFPGEMPERRRYCLAMLSAIDDGVGRIMKRLDQHGIDDNTLVFFISDNGAPLKIDKKDARPITTPGWDGSLNDPWTGEKGMLTEGGIRVPFVARWKGTIPAGQTISDPVISLDVAATAAALAGLGEVKELDGVNLIPRLSGRVDALPERSLYWRFWRQAAIRRGGWKYLYLSDGREWLFDLSSADHETVNLISQNPVVAQEMRADFAAWASELHRPGLPEGDPNSVENPWFKHYLPAGVKHGAL